MSGTIQKNDIITPEALKVFQEIVLEFKKIMQSAEETRKSVKDSGLEEMTFQEKELAKQHQQLGKLTAQLEKSTTGYAKEIIRTKEALRKKNAETKESITGQKAERKAQQEAAAARKAGNAILAKHIQNTKSFNAIIKQGKQQLREQTKEQQRLTREQQKATRAAEKQKKSGSGLTQMFKNLAKSALAYAAAMLGITEIVRFFTSTLLKLTTKLDSLDFSMKTVIESSSEFAQTNIFLSETAINYGQDILTLTERYIKFRAATMQANISAQETQQIFDSAAKAAAVLGLRTDEVNGVFLALEQMISKGKVTTEELRRQLGERLPGAFGIMADAIGVSLRELDKMLKAGEVLSAEALPKFAVALEEAYGIESVTKVETLAAAQGRLKTSWVSFVDEIQASNFYIGIIDTFSEAINGLRNSFGTMSDYDYLMAKSGMYGDILRENVRIFDNFSLERVIAEQDEWIKAFGENTALSKDYINGIFNEYLERRKQAASETENNLIPFDFETEKKRLNDVKKEFENFNNIQKEGFKEVFLENAVFMKSREDTYEDYIQKEIKLTDELIKNTEEKLKQQEESTRISLSKLNELRLLYGESEIEWQQKLLEEAELRYKKQSQIEETAVMNYGGLLEYRTYLASQYGEDELSEEEKNTKNKISFYDAYQQRLEDMFEAHYIERLSMARGNVLEEIRLEEEKIKHQLNSNELTLTERSKLNARLRELNDERIQYEIDQEISSIYERADKARIAEAERAREEFQSTQKRGKDKQLIMAQSALKMIQIEMDAAQEIVRITEEGTDERARAEKDLRDLKERYAETEIQLAERVENKKREEIRNTLNAVKEINQAGFNFNAALNERAMQANEIQYKRETELAGQNAEEKAMAEVRYNEKKRELQRRQAISEKASSAFSIIIDTAAAIMEGLKQTGFLGIPLVPIIAGIGALQLATVLAEPIPEFAKGTKDAPETFIAGEEKGGKRELVLTRSGNTFLTPNEPTLFSDKSFVGATVIPNDQTEAILSGRSGGSSVDLKSTNSLLKNIRDKKDNKEVVEYSGNYRIVNKNGLKMKFRV